MSASLGRSFRACLWLVGRQIRKAARDLAWLMGVSLALSVLIAGFFVHLIILVDGFHPETESANRVRALPAARVVSYAAHWLDSRGRSEDEVGALSGALVWVGCDSPSKCQEGQGLVSAVGATVADSPGTSDVLLEWHSNRWEVSAPSQPKYALPAVVVFYSVLRQSAPQAKYGSFNSVRVLGPDDFLTPVMVNNVNRTLLSSIILVALFLPALQVSVMGASQSLSVTVRGLERGSMEPFVSAPLPPWVIFLSQSLAVGAISSLFALALAIFIQAFVGWINPIGVLSFALGVGAIGMTACMAGLTLATLFYSRVMRWVMGYVSGAVPMLMVLMVVVLGGLVSVLTSRVSSGAAVDAIPLLEWSAAQSLSVLGVVLALAVIVVGAVVALGQSRWGQRRPGLRANR